MCIHTHLGSKERGMARTKGSGNAARRLAPQSNTYMNLVKSFLAPSWLSSVFMGMLSCQGARQRGTTHLC